MKQEKQFEEKPVEDGSYINIFAKTRNLVTMLNRKIFRIKNKLENQNVRLNNSMETCQKRLKRKSTEYTVKRYGRKP